MRRRPEMSGLIDWFLSKFSPPPLPPKEPSLLPAPRFELLPAVPPKEKKSVIEVFKPKPKGLIQAPKGVHEIFVPPQKELLPVRAPEPEKPEVKWAELIPTAEGASVPIAEDLARYLKPSTIYEASRYQHPVEWPYGEPPIWQNTPWKMPSTYEIAQYIQRRWDLNGLYERVLGEIHKPYWQRQVEESAHVGEPAAMEVEQLSDVTDPRSDISRFLRIPDAVIELYGRAGPEGANRYNTEVLLPMLERVEKALEVSRPTPVIRGWFEIEPDEQMNFWLRYKEARFPQEQ
jgi:hypothetical protein